MIKSTLSNPHGVIWCSLKRKHKTGNIEQEQLTKSADTQIYGKQSNGE